MNAPAIVKVLQYLKDAEAPADFNDVITATGESQTLVQRALDRLLSTGMIERAGGGFRYVHTTGAQELSGKLFELYLKVSKKPQMELTIRGIICHLGRSAAYIRVGRLLEVMEKDGFLRGEVVSLLDGELESGYLRKLEVLFSPDGQGSATGLACERPDIVGKIRAVSIPKVPFPPPLAISAYYLSWFRDMSTEDFEKLKMEVLGGNELRREEYITGVYPPEMSQAARSYLIHEKLEMAEALREEAREQWYRLR